VINKPKRLYKYDAISLQALQNLKRQIVYFGSPTRFNDPYDCATKPLFINPDKKQLDAIRHHYLTSSSVPMDKKIQFRDLSDEKLSEVLLRSCRQVFDEILESFVQQRGITCFSEKNDDLLMWSHYADKSTGMCLEFDTSFSPFEKVVPVKYVEEMPTLPITPSLLDGDIDTVQELYCVKSTAWAYEREWRGIHQQRDTAFTYESKCLKGIYFSDKTPDELVEIVCLILRGQNETVQFHSGSRSTVEFKMEFTPFTYTSFLEAKRRGLR
jgi:Protein of unknown function (DUF2971)